MKNPTTINVKIVVETLGAKRGMTKGTHIRPASITTFKIHVNSPATNNNGASIKTSSIKSKNGSIKFKSFIRQSLKSIVQSL